MDCVTQCEARSTNSEHLFYLDSTGTLHALSTTQSCAASPCNDRLSQLDVASLSIAEFELDT